MFNRLTQIAAALSLLAIAGCQTPGAEMLVSQVAPTGLRAVQNDAALTVRCALPPVAAYRVEAVSADIATLTVSLVAANGKTIASQTLTAAQMRSGNGVARFAKLAVATYTLALVAKDAQGQVIGSSKTPATVHAGTTTSVAAKLKLNPTPTAGQTGGIAAEIQIIDGDPAPAPEPTPLPSGDRAPNLVPAHGALWGVYASGPDYAGHVATLEKQVGRRFDIVKRYHDFSDLGTSGVFPTADEKAIAAGGQILDISWNVTIWNKANPSLPKPAGGNYYTYAQINSGSLDGYIDSVAARVKALGAPLFMDFQHESDTKADERLGTPAEFRAAFRRVVTRFRADGVTNAVWCFTVTGYAPNFPKLPALYPGDDVVDWIAWDPYNGQTDHWKDPMATVSGLYDQLENGLLGEGAKNKPWKLSEYGCAPDARRPGWFQALPGVLQQLPKLKAVEYFDSRTPWPFDNDPSSLAAFAQAGHAPYLDPFGL